MKQSDCVREIEKERGGERGRKMEQIREGLCGGEEKGRYSRREWRQSRVAQCVRRRKREKEGKIGRER